MKYLILTIALIVPNFCFGGVSFGLLGEQDPITNRLGLSVGDFNDFRQEPDMFGLDRYGYGSAKINAGNGVGFDTAFYTGYDLITPQDGLMLQLTADLGTLAGHLDTNFYSNYYYMPGIGLGPQFQNNTMKLLIVVIGGGYVGNIGESNLLPDFRPMYGVGSFLSIWRLDFGYNFRSFSIGSIQSGNIIFHCSHEYEIMSNYETGPDTYRFSTMIRRNLY